MPVPSTPNPEVPPAPPPPPPAIIDPTHAPVDEPPDVQPPSPVKEPPYTPPMLQIIYMSAPGWQVRHPTPQG